MAIEKKDWRDVDVVMEQVNHAERYICAVVTKNYRSWIEMVLASEWPYVSLESPLEAVFYLWWNCHDVCHQTESRFSLLTQETVTCSDGQVFRLDFVLTLRDQDSLRRYAEAGLAFPRIAIEVDGHSFHEKTREQVAYRNARDRSLQQDGWIVFHFSWAELMADPAECVGSVIDFAVLKANDCEGNVGRKWVEAHPEARAEICKRLADHEAGV